jgi:hypothetical protein
MSDDPAWDAAAVDRFNATFDAGMRRLFRRDRSRYWKLRRAGHTAECAMDMTIGQLPCSCAVKINQKEATNA